MFCYPTLRQPAFRGLVRAAKCIPPMTIPNSPVLSPGVIKFMPYENFADPVSALTPDQRRQRVAERLRILLGDDEPRELPPNRPLDGHRVSHAICRDGVFVIEASTPALTVMLRFCPHRQIEGDYEIHPGPHGGVERGRPYRVMGVPQDEKNEPASTLTQFPTRYVVFTTASDRHGRHLAWLVGLNSYRRIDRQ